jgi:tetratricopeptide (TPR) repeat protein
MLKKIPYKIKIIIIIILCATTAGIYAYNYVQNNNRKKAAVLKSSSSTQNSKTEIKPASPTAISLSQIKEKQLEDECETGHQAFNNKKYSEAIKIENAVIAKDANFYKAYNIKGIAFSFSNNYEEGMKNIDKALSIKPDFGYARFNKALSYELYGYYDKAISWYNQALNVEKFVWSYYGIASIYGRRGDVQETCRYLKIAIDMQPDIKATARVEKDFDNVKNSKQFQVLIQ